MHEQKPTNAPEEMAPETQAETAPHAEGELTAQPGTEHSEEVAEPVGELLAEIETLRAELAKMKDQALRALADAENTRRRSERDKADALKYASLPLLRDLVKVADNMSRALAHGPAEGEAESPAAKALREGVALTEKELMAAFARHGVSRIDPAGEPLNPERHEAMLEIPDPNAEPGTIVQVLEPGWILHDRLIRPARVGVARKP